MSEQENNASKAPSEKESRDTMKKPVYKKPELRKYGQIDRVTFS